MIVGRGGQCVLRGRDDTFHVFVYGSRQEKLKRIQDRYATENQCEGALIDFDRTRAAYIRLYYDCDWADRALYDLMINSDLGVDRAVSAILFAAGLGTQENRRVALAS